MPARPFVVDVGRVLRAFGSVERFHVEGSLRGLGVVGTRVPDDAQVAVDVAIEGVPEAVIVHGTVTAPWTGECRRCLGPVHGTVVTEVRELVEETPTEEDAYPLHGDQVDLEPLARDAVLLELPLAPLCAESCAGLCPTCGANRNEGDCGCAPGERDPRWAALDALREPTAED
jgi:uncharacterized protein